MAPLILTSGPVRCEGGTSPVGMGTGGDGYRLVTVHTYGNFIVLTHWNTRPPAPWASHSVALSWQWANQSLSYANNVEHQAKEWQVSILKSLIWLDQDSKTTRSGFDPWPSDSPILENGRRTLYSFGHPDWLLWLGTAATLCTYSSQCNCVTVERCFHYFFTLCDKLH